MTVSVSTFVFMKSAFTRTSISFSWAFSLSKLNLTTRPPRSQEVVIFSSASPNTCKKKGNCERRPPSAAPPAAADNDEPADLGQANGPKQGSTGTAISQIVNQVAALSVAEQMVLMNAVSKQIPVCSAKLDFFRDVDKFEPDGRIHLSIAKNEAIWSILQALRKLEVCAKAVANSTLPLLVADSAGKMVHCGSWTQPDVAKLLSLAKPSPFGRGRQTIYDKTVRDAMEIAADRIKRVPRCNFVRNITFTPHKLQIYQVGGHFKSHRDTAYTTNHVMSAVMLLPTEFEGGDLVVEGVHGEQRLGSNDLRTSTTTTSAPAASVAKASSAALPTILFQRDLLHRVEPVTKGVRLAFQYNGMVAKVPSLEASLDVLPDDETRFEAEEDETCSETEDETRSEAEDETRSETEDEMEDKARYLDLGFCSAGSAAAQEFVRRNCGLKHLADPLLAKVRKLVASAGAVVLPLEHEYPVAPINQGELPDDYPLNGVDALLLHLLRQAHDVTVTINVVSAITKTLCTKYTQEHGNYGGKNGTDLCVFRRDRTIRRATLVCPSTSWMYARHKPQDGDTGNEAHPAEVECVALGLLIRKSATGKEEGPVVLDDRKYNPPRFGEVNGKQIRESGNVDQKNEK